MNKCRSKPDRKACTQYDPEGQALAKANKDHKKKQNARHNAPQSSLAVTSHKSEIVGIVHIQPDKYDKAG